MPTYSELQEYDDATECPECGDLVLIDNDNFKVLHAEGSNCNWTPWRN